MRRNYIYVIEERVEFDWYPTDNAATSFVVIQEMLTELRAGQHRKYRIKKYVRGGMNER